MATRGPVKNCQYFPCHRELEDCTFCYCPFYPCLDKKKGRFAVSDKTGGTVWDCSGCVWIHREKTVELIYVRLKRDQDMFLEEPA